MRLILCILLARQISFIVAALDHDISAVSLVQRKVITHRAVKTHGHDGQKQRHIQYLVTESRGIGDRHALFRLLAWMGEFHNATVHIKGGTHGVSRWLTSQHSTAADLAADWSHYFNISGYRGNPFHELEPLAGCKEMSDPDTRFETMFADGSECINITRRLKDFNDFQHRNEYRKDIHIRPSQDVISKAYKLREGLPKDFGAMHIRRCDRMNTNAVCTSVESIYSLVESNPTVKSWIFFYYAEPGYRDRLKESLSTFSNRTFVFEDELNFGTDDNYFIMSVQNIIANRAHPYINLHKCQKGKQAILDGQAISLLELKTEELRRGECFS
mmetsp:Transcript_144112/g.268466  ORF Transcript_144112/g.268466 Transcript_144112/m.268466 type:complete len:329 (+) Transcript_144112:68-1054(+)